MTRPSSCADPWWVGGKDESSFCVADPVTVPIEILTANVNTLLRERGGEGPVSYRLQAAIAREHEALVLRVVGVARAEGRSLGWLVKVLRQMEDMGPGMAVLPPAAYQAKRLGRPDPGGTWHRATLSRIFHRVDFHTALAQALELLTRIVREDVLPGLYSGRGLDWTARQLNRIGVPTEDQIRRELIGGGLRPYRWTRGQLKAFLVRTSAACLHSCEPAERGAAIWRRHVARPWSRGVGPAKIAGTLNEAGVLTPSQHRDHCDGRR